MGNFDQEILAALTSGDISEEGNAARRQAALRLNAQAGRPNSEAVSREQIAALQQQLSGGGLPNSAPVPASRPMNNIAASIDEQVGDVPLPTPRPDTAAVDPSTGDAAVLEAMQGAQPAPQSNVDQAIAVQMGDASVAEQMSTQAPTQVVAAPPTQAQPAGTPLSTAATGEQSGDNSGNMIAFLTVAGGLAGAAALALRARMGDPDAANTFKAYGMRPDDFAMFADNPLNQRSGRYDYRMDYGPDESKAAEPAPTRSPNAPKAPKQAPAKTPEAAEAKSPVAERVDARIASDDKSKKRRLSAKNLPTSRPKIKVKAK